MFFKFIITSIFVLNDGEMCFHVNVLKRIATSLFDKNANEPTLMKLQKLSGKLPNSDPSVISSLSHVASNIVYMCS